MASKYLDTIVAIAYEAHKSSGKCYLVNNFQSNLNCEIMCEDYDCDVCIFSHSNKPQIQTIKVLENST